MSRPRAGAQRLHAIKVAAVATAIVAIVAIVLALILNMMVTHRLQREMDTKLSERLTDTANSPLPGRVQGEGDLDDAPTFVWIVSLSGHVAPLTADAPILPSHRWSTNPIDLPVGGSSFRLDSIPSRFGWLVAGESVSQIGRINDELLLVEGFLGALLLVVTFAGSLMVGLRASAPIEEVRRRQSEFTADASHELRTPLSVLEAEVELALSRNRDPVVYRETLRRVSTESARLRSIVNDLLWLARADGDAPHDDTDEIVDMGIAVETCVDRFTAVAGAQGIALSYRNAGAGATFVRSPPDSIERLLGVLVDNACRYAGAGGTVKVAVAQSGNHVVLTVDDSGPGIPDEQRDLVFDRFHRATDTSGGTGLGLAIADAVVRNTNGEWSVGMSPLGGAQLGVTWRRAPDHPSTRNNGDKRYDRVGRSPGSAVAARD
jgi:signal transduction histidine kinase